MNKRNYNQISWKQLDYHKLPRTPDHYFDRKDEKVTLLKFSNSNIERDFDRLTIDNSFDHGFEKNHLSEDFASSNDNLPNKCDNYISIFWDLDSCPASDKSPSFIVNQLKDKFITDDCNLAFTVITSCNEIKNSVAYQLEFHDVDVVFSPQTDVKPLLNKIIYEQAETVLNLDTVLYNIVIITNNLSIVRDLAHLARENIKLILYCSKVAEEFFSLVHEVRKFQEIFIAPAISSKSCLGRISGDFHKDELGSLKFYLQRLFANYGVVRNLKKKEAVIHFPNLEAALEAKERFDGRRVAGYKIVLNLDHGSHTTEPLQDNEVLPNDKNFETSNFFRPHKTVIFISIKFIQDIPAINYNGCLHILRKIFGVDFTFDLENYVKISDTNEIKAEVMVASMKKARQAIKMIKEWNTCYNNSYQADPLSFYIYASVTSDPSELEKKSSECKIKVRNDVKRDCMECFKFHKTKEMQLKDNLEDIEEKLDQLNYKDVSDCKKVSSLAEERETILSKIEELKEQEEEFTSFAAQVFLKIDSLETNQEFEKELVKLILSFSREVHYFKNGLPIYAKRSFIIDTIKKNPVCVLLAETGSGKSTQLVQYLDQFGLHQGKLIACTQPRKIAVTSLATHVASQMGSSVGLQVGYKTGLKAKVSDETCIVYMTDTTLLNECLKDPLFSKYSCIIIDEAHERSINTDLLLGMLKNCLTQRRDLKVVITSATIDPSKFVDYFRDIGECPIVKVPGRVFPVELKYLPQKEDFKGDYMNEALKLVEKIHKEEEKGDLLVFLTSPLETERSAKLLEDLNHKGALLILQLHGRLQMEEQQKVFKATPPGKRKVVFATNSAETSITIPGIRYVIDTGVVKERIFDPKTNRSRLVVGPVSKSAADQRKGRAGRMEPGKCFRLFSNESYDKLESAMLPEILRINLGQAILKLMELGVQDPINFDFVEAPSLDALVVAMEELKSLKAIEDGSLTTLGTKMAKLPLEPRLAKLVLLGLESKIPFETLIVASISSTSGIYFRVGSKEEIAKSDLQRMQSSMPEGDLVTMLDIFSKWWEVEEKKKGTWCRDKWLNGKAMKSIRELLNELEKIISTEFNIKLGHTFATDKDHVNISLKWMIFMCFFNNLCLFSGHEKIGYITLNDYQLVQIHPSSALSYLGKKNFEYIVYDQQMTTSRDFILNVTPVLSTWVEDFIQKGILNLDNSKIEKLRFHKQTFGPIGGYVLKKHVIGSKAQIQLELEDSIKKKYCNENVRLATDVPKGEINVYAPFKNTFAEDILQPVITLGKEELERASQTLPSLSQCQSFNMQGILVKGFQIHDIIFQGEYREIVIRNVPEMMELKNVVKKFKSYGEISHFFERFEKDDTKSVIIVYFSPHSAKKAVETDFENKLLVQPRGKLYSSKASSSFYKMKMSWIRRKSKGHGFLTFVNPEHHNIAVMTASYLDIPTDHPDAPSQSVSCQFMLKRHRRSSKYNLALSQIPAYVTSNDLKEATRQKFPDFPVDSVFVVCDSPFTTTKEQYESVLDSIKQEFAQLGIQDGVDINLLKPKDHNVMWIAFLYFEKANDIQAVFNALNNTKAPFSNDHAILMQPQLQVKIFLNMNIFNVIKEPLEEYMNSLNTNDLDTTRKRTLLVEKGKKTKDKVLISIDTNNLDDLCKIFTPVSELTSGKKISFQDTILFNALKTSAWNQLKQIQEEFGVFVQMNNRTSSLSVFGKKKSVEDATLQIKKVLTDLEIKNTFEIPLLQIRGLLKRLILSYGLDLSKLIEETGLKTVKINVNRHLLIGTGSQEAYLKLCDIIQSLKDELLPSDNLSDESDEETCPICLMEVCPGMSSYRLQYCGHLHCIECISAQLQQKILPFKCSVESCGKMFVLEDFKFLLDTNSHLYQELINLALKEFVTKNKDRVNFCPTANCAGILRIEAESKKYFCQACKNDICTRCNVLYHHGMSCEIFQSGFSDDPSLRNWQEKDPRNRKLCPKCSTPIEKNAGCNHMNCTNCNSHLCWLCLKICESANDVYFHLRTCPEDN